MKPIPLGLAAAVAVAGAAATPAAAHGAYCRLPAHHHAYRHAVRHVAYRRPYAYRYAAPAYYGYGGYGWREPYYYRTYSDWSYAPPPAVWVDYGPDYGWYDDGWRWRHGHWHGHGHWDHGRHRGWR